MVMDYLLCGAYTRHANVVIGGTPVTIRWFPAHRYAKPFPYPRAIGSNQWLSDNLTVSGIGEVQEPKTRVPDRYGLYSGITFCGRPEWFLTGIPADAPTGLPPCPRCVIPATAGGAQAGGRSPLSSRGGAQVSGATGIPPKRAGGAKAGGVGALLRRGGLVAGGTTLVATGAYSTAFGTAWDSYRFV